MTSRRNKLQLKVLQRRCTRTFRLYMDLAEASCDLLCHCDQLPPRERALLTRLRRQESTARDAYLQARTNLTAALIDSLPAADKEICHVVSVTT